VIAPEVIVLGRRDVAGLMRPADWLAAVEAGYRALVRGEAEAPGPLHLPADGGGFHAKGASFRDGGRAWAALKVNGNFPGNPAARGLPTVQGAVLLFDAETGSPLAVMDSIELTLRRTAAAAALAARSLARPDAAVAAVCGRGAQAGPQLEALAEVLPLSRALAWDADPARAEAFAAGFQRLPVTAVANLEEATREAEVIVTCTTACEPFLEPRHVRPGTFVAAVGADSPHKSEIAPALMARARVVCDSVEQALAMGDLRHAVAAGAMTVEQAAGDLAGLVSGAVEGRQTDDQITLFDSTGMGLQDVAAAARVYLRALAAGSGFACALGAA
jgi:ornithine cyclodeaminase/alanine dehydrogenase-like protein (mu-crystallin family)